MPPPDPGGLRPVVSRQGENVYEQATQHWPRSIRDDRRFDADGLRRSSGGGSSAPRRRRVLRLQRLQWMLRLLGRSASPPPSPARRRVLRPGVCRAVLPAGERLWMLRRLGPRHVRRRLEHASSAAGARSEPFGQRPAASRAQRRKRGGRAQRNVARRTSHAVAASVKQVFAPMTTAGGPVCGRRRFF